MENKKISNSEPSKVANNTDATPKQIKENISDENASIKSKLNAGKKAGSSTKDGMSFKDKAINKAINATPVGRARSKIDYLANKYNFAKKLKETMDKIIKMAKWIAANAKPILIVAAVVTVVYNAVVFGIGIAQNFGSSPHYYCDLEPDESTKKSVFYKQYCSDGNLDTGDGIAERMSQLCWDTEEIGKEDFDTNWKDKGSPYCIYDGKSHTDPCGIVCGTDLYIYVHDKVLPGDQYYASCDRSTTTAVRWSGADDKFADPNGGPCPDIITYCSSNSDKWEDVTSTIHSIEDLQPGDVCVYSEHIVTFLGEEAVLKYHPDVEVDLASGKHVWGEGSFGNHAPSIDSRSDISCFTTGTGKVFRIKEYQSDSEFKDMEIPAEYSNSNKK